MKIDKTKNAVSIFNKYAKEYAGKFMDVSMYAASFDFFCEAIKSQNAEVLELACGPGNITKHLLNQRPDFKLLGLDLAPNMVDLAKENNPSAQFKVMDCRDILILNKKFDAIMCGFCLPYLSQEETTQLIKDSAILLNTNGLIYLSTMEDDYEKSGFKKGSKGDEIFMHYYKEDFLSKIFAENGFTILKTERIYSQMLEETVTDLVIIAKK
ncbi:MAG: class I SAM-dependent methyltransferase [Bacteroidota bacterium]|nr:class I SAM-dependent methyltransferase [Bacteroidota bacterium]